MIFFLLGCTKSSIEEDARRENRNSEALVASTNIQENNQNNEIQDITTEEEGSTSYAPKCLLMELAQKIVANPLEQDENNRYLISNILKDKEIGDNNREMLVNIFVSNMRTQKREIPLSNIDLDPVAIALNRGYENIAMKLVTLSEKIYCLDESGRQISYFTLLNSNNLDNITPNIKLLDAVSRKATVEDVLRLDPKLTLYREVYRFKLHQILRLLSVHYVQIRDLSEHQKASALNQPVVTKFFQDNITDALSLIEKSGICFFSAPRINGDAAATDNLDLLLLNCYRPIIFYVLLMQDVVKFNEIESHLNSDCVNLHNSKATTDIMNSLLAEVRTFSDDIRAFWTDNEENHYYSTYSQPDIDESVQGDNISERPYATINEFDTAIFDTAVGDGEDYYASLKKAASIDSDLTAVAAPALVSLEEIAANIINGARDDKSLGKFKESEYPNLSEDYKKVFDIELTNQIISFLKEKDYAKINPNILCFRNNTEHLISILNAVPRYAEETGQEASKAMVIKQELMKRLLLNITALESSRDHLSDESKDDLIEYINKKDIQYKHLNPRVISLVFELKKARNKKII